MATIKELSQRVLESIGLTTTNQMDKQINRAYESGVFDGNDDPQSGTIAAGGFGYTSQGQRGKRDFQKMTPDQILNTVWAEYQSSGIAKRALEFRLTAILGRNTAPETADEALQIILDQFWKRNLIKNGNLARFVTSHSLFGELILPVFVRQNSDGRVLLGYIDPGDIDTIIFHPQNNLERWAVILKKGVNDKNQKCYRIIREDEGGIVKGEFKQPTYPDKLITDNQAILSDWELAFLKEKGLSEYTGSCFYFDKNNLANQPRGFSDLLQSVDWLDLHADVLFSLAERENLGNYFSWDVELAGADPTKVQERAAKLGVSPPMGKGQVNVHNDSEKWTYVSPDLKQPGTVETSKVIKTQILEGLNQPEHWHNEPNTTNRATAAAADSPVNRTLEHEQSQLVGMLVFMCQFAADQAEILGTYKPGEDNEIKIQVPEIVKGDIFQVSEAFTQTVNALVVSMLDLKVIDREIASQVVSKIIAEYGVQYNPAEKLTEIDEKVKSAALETQEEIDNTLAGILSRNGNT